MTPKWHLLLHGNPEGIGAHSRPVHGLTLGVDDGHFAQGALAGVHDEVARLGHLQINLMPEGVQPGVRKAWCSRAG